MYCIIWISTISIDTFDIQNSINQDDQLSPFHSNFDLRYTLRTVQDIQMALTLNRMYQLLVSVDDVNIAEGNTNISEKGTEVAMVLIRKMFQK